MRISDWSSDVCSSDLSVLQVIYLIFNEGYAASSGGSLTRHDLSAEAIRLARLLVQLLSEPEALGLLALMVLHDSRRAARVSPAGDLVLLEAQDRTQWNRELISDDIALRAHAMASRRIVRSLTQNAQQA